MSIIHAMNNETENSSHYYQEFPYVVSGRKDMSVNKTDASIGIVLLHNIKNKNISVEQSLEEYTAIYSHKIVFAHSDGSPIPNGLQELFPDVYFFHVEKENNDSVSVGELLNVLFNEVQTDLLFVSWTDVNPFGISTRTLLQNIDDFPLCMVPVFEDYDGNVVPLVYKPHVTISGLSVSINPDILFFPYTFLPHNFVGVFHRKKFLSLGGFDKNISDTFWQLCDFSVRIYSLGFHIKLSSFYRVKKHFSKKEVKSSKNSMYHFMCLKYCLGMQTMHRIKYTLSVLFSKTYVSKITKEKLSISKSTDFLTKL